MKNYPAIVASMAFVFLNIVVCLYYHNYFDGTRLQNIFSIASGSTLTFFPAWGEPQILVTYALNHQPKEIISQSVNIIGEGLTLYYIPVLAKTLGFNYPLIAIITFFAVILFLINYYAYKFANSKLEIIFIIIANLLILEQSLINYANLSFLSVYFVKGFVIVLLFSLFKFLSANKLNFNGIVLIIIFALLANIRNSIGIVFIVFIFILLILHFLKKEISSVSYKNLGYKNILVMVLVFFSIKNLASEIIITNPEFIALSQSGDHVFWHTIWCSIGAYDPNNLYGFQWSDAAARNFAENLSSKKLIFASVEYEQILKNYILEISAKDPKFIFGYIFNRLFLNWYFYIALIINIFILFFKNLQKSNYFIIFLSLLPLSVFKAEEVLSISSIQYVFPINTYILLIFIFFSFYLIHSYFQWEKIDEN